MTLKIDKEVENLIREHANRVYPEECCGALFGKLDSDERIIIDYMELDNADDDGNRQRNFEISPDDYMRAEKHADENGMVMAGIYHSHPDAAPVPSEKDQKKAMPVFSYVIISIKGGEQGELRAWKLNREGRFDEESVSTVYEREPDS